MSNKHSYLAKNVVLFAIGNFAPKILTFILVPLYTSCLSTEEYGISDLISTTVQLLLPIFTLDIQDAVLRFSLDEDFDKKEVFSSSMKIVLNGALIVTAASILLSVLKIPGVSNVYLMFFVLMYITHALYNSIVLFCRGVDCVSVVMGSSIINSIVALSANILFLVVFEWGLIGYLLANTIGSILALVWCFFGAKLYRYIVFKPSRGVSRLMITFSFPLIFNVLAWWINQSLDRYILSWMVGVSVSGIYAVSYKIPSLISICQSVFAQAWSISAVKEFDKDDSDGFVSDMYTLMNGGMAVVCSFVMIINIPLAKLLYSNNFFEAWQYAPPLMLSVVANAMSLFIGSIFTAVKDTKTIAVSTVVGAIINLVCNFIFIYYWSAYGAALATLLGYAVTLAMRHILLCKHIRLRINWYRDIAVYALLVLQMIIANGGVSAMLPQLGVFAVIMLLYIKEIKQALIFVKGKFFRKKAQ